ncbi:MAG TPA: 50S ribosomal protein L27 [Candidatus Sulfotelmatobacter sp.]|jgi:large subunit ribosomal protein L27|nr:50S ribosomal protein L27 [Candidatus Sulfotelmatobacter sp.]
MAHTKAQGSVKGNRDSRPKRRGVKMYGGAHATTGNIIVRQKGSKFSAGSGVSMGRDFTLFAMQEGIVTFKTLKGKKYVEVING